MGVEIKIDTREPHLQALLQAYYLNADISQQTTISLTTHPLDVGDVEIQFGQTSILFERKTLNDLASSVKDNRYKEQKIRLLAKVPAQHIIYVLEGVPSHQTLLNSNFPIQGLKPSVLSGVMIYTMLRDGMHVLPVPNTHETAAWIWSIALKCVSNPEKIQIEAPESGGGAAPAIDYLQHIKIKKIDNITPDNCYVMQLCQIPNVSIRTAREIAKKYTSMLSLLVSLSKLPNLESRITCLTEIPMIGKKKAAILLEYLLPENNTI